MEHIRLRGVMLLGCEYIIHSELFCIFALTATLLMAPIAYAQEGTVSMPPEVRIESRQGYPGQPDVIAHMRVLKGTHFQCIKVEHHPKSSGDHAACRLKFENGTEQTLDFSGTTDAKADGEVYLDCLGDRPAACEVGLWNVAPAHEK